jgi:hypothetical protein
MEGFLTRFLSHSIDQKVAHPSIKERTDPAPTQGPYFARESDTDATRSSLSVEDQQIVELWAIDATRQRLM